MTTAVGLRKEQRRVVTLRGRRLLRAAASMAAMFASLGVADAQVTRGAPLPSAPKPPATEAPRPYDAAELDRIVSPIALYPDPLLAQVLNAATFPEQIPIAAQWLDAHSGEPAQQLTDALARDSVAWDPSVQAMVAFPTVLQMMASALPWTEEMGDAFARQPEDVMDAVQRMRTLAQRYGYLRSTDQLRVTTSPAVEIHPVSHTYIVVPYYDPYIVFSPPRPRFLLSSAIYLGYGVRLGLWFEPWGWRRSGFAWAGRRVLYGGYPGWNHRRNYRVVTVRGYRYEPRYTGSSERRSYRDGYRDGYPDGRDARRDDRNTQNGDRRDRNAPDVDRRDRNALDVDRRDRSAPDVDRRDRNAPDIDRRGPDVDRRDRSGPDVDRRDRSRDDYRERSPSTERDARGREPQSRGAPPRAETQSPQPRGGRDISGSGSRSSTRSSNNDGDRGRGSGRRR